MPMVRFRCILFGPPPDCARCAQSTVWINTPEQFREPGLRTFSGVRRLCSPCYRYLHAHDRDALADYPRVYRSSQDTYEEFLTLKSRYPRWTKREIAALIGITPTALAQAIVRSRRQERKNVTDQERVTAA